MMRTPHCRRPGLSLTEVLVALFVMALGIISLMTLFPLGAVQMGQALRDDRSGQTASQADGIVRLWWQTEVAEVRQKDLFGTLTPSSPTAGTLTLPLGHNILVGEALDVKWLVSGGGQRLSMTVTGVFGVNVTVNGGTGVNLPAGATAITVQLYEDAFWQAMDNPNYPGLPSLAQPLRSLDGNPSYPVFLDPIGWQARVPGTQNWIAPFAATGNIPRRSTRPLLSPIVPQNTLSLAVRGCSMMDDMTFTELGVPDTASGSIAGNVVREGAYNWCAVIQRPNNANRYIADFKVCVFHTKGLYGGHIPGISSVNEFVFNLAPLPPGNGGVLGSATLTGTQVVLNVPVGNLPIRSGSWIMDGSNSAVTNFYRIQSVTDNGASTILELDTPLKGTTPITQMYIIRGLADVFDRPQLTASGYSRQAP